MPQTSNNGDGNRSNIARQMTGGDGRDRRYIFHPASGAWYQITDDLVVITVLDRDVDQAIAIGRFEVTGRVIIE